MGLGVDPVRISISPSSSSQKVVISVVHQGIAEHEEGSSCVCSPNQCDPRQERYRQLENPAHGFSIEEPRGCNEGSGTQDL